MHLFSVATLLLILATLLVALLAFALIGTVRLFRRRARRAGYSSVGEYLRAAPRTDSEKRDAIDLALWGVAICLLGLLFPPLLIIGVFPLFHGARKVTYSALGLGLVDDIDDEIR